MTVGLAPQGTFTKYINMSCQDTDQLDEDGIPISQWSLNETDSNLMHDWLFNRNNSEIGKQMLHEIKDSKASYLFDFGYVKFWTQNLQ